MGEVVSLKKSKTEKRLSYRAQVSEMDKMELMGEFIATMNRTAGKGLSLQEAEDCQYLMERLLAASEEETFKHQLRYSIKVLKAEISKRRN